MRHQFLFLCAMATATIGNAHNPIQFTKAEKAWIAAHPVIRVVYDADFRPFSYLSHGVYRGLVADYLNFIANVSGLRFEAEPDSGDRDDLQHRLGAREIDLVAVTVKSSVLNQPRLLYTTPFYKGNSVIVTRSSELIVPRLRDLDGKKLAVRNGTYMKLVNAEYPDIVTMPFSTQEKAMEAVAGGLADAALDLDAVLIPIMHHRYASQLNVSGVAADIPIQLRMGVRPELRELASIINKSMASMTAKQRDELAKKWLNSGDYGAPNWVALLRYYTLELAVAGAAILLMFILVLRERQAGRRATRSEREKSLFLAVMSHEIRSPMNAILSSIELLQEQQLDSSANEILTMAGTASESLLALLDNLLDFSKLEARRLELMLAPHELRTLVQDAVSMARLKARFKGLPIHVNISTPHQCHVVVDAARLRQILINLLSNATKFTDHGAIHVTAGFTPLSIGEPNGTLAITVVDSGIGISAEAQKRLFRPFSQACDARARHRGGSGLGLAICRELIVLMGGSIDLRSAPGTGTTVSIRIPCQSQYRSEQKLPEPLPVTDVRVNAYS